MRLVVFGSGHPYRGGIARTTTEMVSALIARGHHVSFRTPRKQYPNWLFPGQSDEEPEACRRLECASRDLQPLNPVSWLGSRRHARALGGEAWILTYWTWAWAGLWHTLLMGDRPPVVVVVHNPADHGATVWGRLAARSVFRRCQALFTHARVLEDHLREICPDLPIASHPMPATEIGSLPPRDQARAAYGIPVGRRVALFLGLIRPYKGVDLLLDAMAALPPETDWKLIVAGEPWRGLGVELAAQVRRLGLSDRVDLRFGWVPESDVPGLLSAADLVVLPYRSGSQSAIAPLALGAGVPVLSTAVGGLPEVIRDGVNGLVVTPNSASALTKALNQLDPGRLAALKSGAEQGCDRMSWNGYAKKLENLIRGISRA